MHSYFILSFGLGRGFLLPVMLNRTYAIQFHCGFHSDNRIGMGKGEIVSVSRDKAVDAA